MTNVVKKNPWTESEIATLRSMASTHKVADIAIAIDRTRNMVIGKAGREGIELTYFASAPVVSSWSDADVLQLHQLAKSMTAGEIAKVIGRAKTAVHAKAVKEGLSLAAVRIPVEPVFRVESPVPEDVWEAIEGSRPVTIEHHKTGCRWPIGEHPVLFCNRSTSGKSPYCQHHRARGTKVYAPSMTNNGRRR